MKSAVLVIDVQNILFDPTPQPFERNEVLTRINKVTDWARQKDISVIFIQHEQTGTPIEYGSEGWQLQSSLHVESSDHFIRKTTPDSFLRTNLESLLQELCIEHLYICGYATEFCVDTTTRRAAGLGYSVDLISDAHTTQSKSHLSGEQIRVHHNATLPSISSFGVKITAVSTQSLTS
ncbi:MULTISPECIES: cysteine hydrolase family protein [Vibrio]|uniref:Cysteine hydrolase n=16 Tax=Vibrio TaxID=662 RepID=A0AAW4BNA7_VIBAN|nr:MULTISPECIES: cysteine hydrolase family protein [Vibrio]ASG05482.1 cysteine hydrolase [Vibrio anguillarum]ATC59599.1 cysteine hydrolase [Vibrio anguillarum]MBE3654874.1 cysteine hydrolase [Vibrio navarrensis]MBF4242603.1 cysteine hydrolase [Vibrio anguillarum]MBF4252283.1 cysteine hydrolase [Vibrio anguillarum]